MVKDIHNNLAVGDRVVYTSITGNKIIGTVHKLEAPHTGGTAWIDLNEGNEELGLNLKQVTCCDCEKIK